MSEQDTTETVPGAQLAQRPRPIRGGRRARASPAEWSDGRMPKSELEEGPGDWTEDFPYENGKYVCMCCVCQETFLGHKRRVVCKLCHGAYRSG